MKKTFDKISAKKLLSLLLAAMLSAGACSCDFFPQENSLSDSVNSSVDSGKDDSSDDSSSDEKPEEEGPNYTLDSYDFTTVFTDGASKTLRRYNPEVPSENGSAVYDVYSNIGNKNYLKLDLTTDVDLVGYINYYNNADKSVTHSEKFFVEANSTQFITFLDAFRAGAYGAFEKTITTISFQNVDATKEGKLTFVSAGICDRKIVTDEYMYVSDGSTVVGTSAFYGGCITHLEKLEQDVVEYMDSDGNIRIDRDIDPDSVPRVSSTSVNMVNIMDLGREIQPSYYSGVKKANGYDPQYDPDDVYDGLTGNEPVYNPIQCGDYGGHSPQIIDYNYQSDRLYIKMKAQEWFFGCNIQANGYIEVTYYFDENGSLMVDNRYTDFSQFINEYDVPMHMQETPATYIVYPFNYFYCETKQGTIFDEKVGEQNGRTQSKHTANQAVTGDYIYDIKAKNLKNGWCAFVNENKFGVGIYMPNADKYVASRGRKSVNYFSEKGNSRYYEEFFQFGEDELVPSYAVFNYSYINPSLNRRMIQFVPLEYTYALFIGDTEEMGDAFDGLKKKGVTNAHLADEETRGWPDY